MIEEIADIENLQLAYYKAQKGKSSKVEVFEYGKRLCENLRILQQQIRSGNVETGNYHYFTIYDPKKRLICAAPIGQRIMHHALMNVCHPFFERAQIFDSYASRIGKGTHGSIERAKHFNKCYKWFLKIDFRKYFDSLDHRILKEQLRRLFKDKRLLVILNRIIDSYSVNQNKGVPIGNLTSQYFANHYLTQADHYAKEVLRIPAYVRYMDDIVLWHNNKESLKDTGFKLLNYTEYALELKAKPFCLNRNSQGLPFLGYLLSPDKTRLAHRSRSRFIEKLTLYEKKFDPGKMDAEGISNSHPTIDCFYRKGEYQRI